MMLLLGAGTPVFAAEMAPLRVSTLLGEAVRNAVAVFDSDELDPPQLELSRNLAAGETASALVPLASEPTDLPFGKSAGTRIGISETLGYDSNTFRMRDAAAASAAGLAQMGSWLSQTKLALGLDKSYAGQQVLLDYDLNMARYGAFGFLDNNASTATGRWRWTAGKDWKGELSSEYRESLDDYAYYRTPVRSIGVTRQMQGSGYYRLAPEWQLGVVMGRGNRRYPDGTRPTNEIDFSGVDGVLRYAPESGNVVAITRRRARGEYPNLPSDAGSLAEKRFHQDETNLEVSLPLRSGSRYLMRVGSISRSYERYPQSNFSGRVGLLGAEWQLTPRTQLSGALRYDVEPAQDFVSSYVATKGLRLGGLWDYSTRTRVEGRYDWRLAQYRGDPGFGAVSSSRREDRGGIATLMSTWRMAANTRWITTLTRERRSSNQAEWSFNDWTVAGSLQWVF